MDGFIYDRYTRFNALTGQEAKWSGHSIWQYVAETYGKKLIRNILFMSVVNRNVDAGFRNVVAFHLQAILQGWRQHYMWIGSANHFRREPHGCTEDSACLRGRSDERITHIESTKEASASVVNCQGRYSLVHLATWRPRDTRVVHRGGFRIPQNADRAFPCPPGIRTAGCSHS